MLDFSVIVDTREQLPLEFKGVATIRRGLKTGDYSIEGYETRVAIERKSLSDLLGSITTNRERFNACMERLVLFESKAILVEATPSELERGHWIPKVSPNSVIGTLFKWKMRGIPVIYAANHEKASHYALWFLRLFYERRNGPTFPGVEGKAG